MNKILKRLNKKASFKRITKDKDDFIQECEDSGKFDEDQLYQIRLGFEKGLTIEEVKLYADSKFNYLQMCEIRRGFENRLTMEQVKLYADSKFSYWQIDEIRKGFKNGLTMEEVKLYTDPKFNDN